MIKSYITTAVFVLSVLGVSVHMYGGNPDRQGEAGAYELLMNPWARSAGLSSMTASNVKGVESMRINVAGLSRINSTEITLGHTDYLSATNTKVNAIGIAQKLGKKKNGALGISLMAIDFGDIRVTTTDQPDGTGATYEPTFFNFGLSYSYIFDNKISVGFTFRVVSESNNEINGMGVAIDAGVQYVTGERDNFKFGIALRNVGTRMKFSGQGISFKLDPDGNGPNEGIILKQDVASFELPSLLNIGVSNDFYAGQDHRITVLGSFTANSFSRDQVGGGVEYAFKELFMLRAGYRAELGSDENVDINNVYSGFSAGATLSLGLSKDNPNSRLYIDYAYRTTEVFDGTHNFGVSIAL